MTCERIFSMDNHVAYDACKRGDIVQRQVALGQVALGSCTQEH
jgi:hypothetical protein